MKKKAIQDKLDKLEKLISGIIAIPNDEIRFISRHMTVDQYKENLLDKHKDLTYDLIVCSGESIISISYWFLSRKIDREINLCRYDKVSIRRKEVIDAYPFFNLKLNEI